MKDKEELKNEVATGRWIPKIDSQLLELYKHYIQLSTSSPQICDECKRKV